MLRSFVLLLALPTAALAAEPLTLEQAVALALERNERALIATERVAAAEARVARARSFFFPTLSVTGTYTRQPERRSDATGAIIRPENALNATAAMRVDLFNGSVVPLWRAAVSERAATGLESVNERRLTAFEAADAFLQTLGSQRVAEAARRRFEVAKLTLEEAQVRAKAQLVSSNDVTRAQVELAAAEQAAIRAQGDADTASLLLAYVIGEDAPRPLAPIQSLVAEDARPDADPDALVERALSGRPDVAAAQKRVEVADALADEPLWRFVPSLGLSAQYAVNNTATFGAGQNEWNASVVLRWELLDPTRFADRAERLAEERMARLNAEAAQRTARLDVRQALLSLQVAEGAVRQAQTGVEVARRNAEETAVLYREGLARAIEVADASLRLFEADVALARERYARDQAWLDLRASLGLDPLGREMKE